MREIKERLGFKIGDICKLSPKCFEVTHSKRGLERRFEVIGFGEGWHNESVRVKRLDLSSGRREYYHHTLLQKLRAGEKY